MSELNCIVKVVMQMNQNVLITELIFRALRHGDMLSVDIGLIDIRTN